MTKKIHYPVETERLELAPYKAEYGVDLYKLKLLPETHRFNYTPVMSLEDSKKYAREFSEYDYQAPKERMELAVILKKEKKYIGYIGFKTAEYGTDSSAEIYYTLHPDYFKRGLGTEAVRGMLKLGFKILGLHRIWAGATCENTASWKIMEKLGMRRECHWLKDRPKPGKWTEGKGFEKTGEWENGYGYAILKDEFSG